MLRICSASCPTDRSRCTCTPWSSEHWWDPCSTGRWISRYQRLPWRPSRLVDRLDGWEGPSACCNTSGVVEPMIYRKHWRDRRKQKFWALLQHLAPHLKMLYLPANVLLHSFLAAIIGDQSSGKSRWNEWWQDCWHLQSRWMSLHILVAPSPHHSLTWAASCNLGAHYWYSLHKHALNGQLSLIQRICGVDLPRSDGTCTRCPMEVRLMASENWSCCLKIR